MNLRNPSSDKIVRQLEEGIGNGEDLLKTIYSDVPQFRELYQTIENLIENKDVASANDIVEGNYEALLEQLSEGTFGVEQVAMLDILAFLFLRLENEDAAEQLCGQVCILPHLVKLISHYFDVVLVMLSRQARSVYFLRTGTVLWSYIS